MKAALLVLLSVAASACGRAATGPDDRALQLRELLRKLQTTARLMHTTAHPDDEDGGMLTLESRGQGTEVLLFTLTRGEGGQNKMGSNLLDSLGVLRTLELLASDHYYGVEQRFSRVADFGFSKSPTETFEKWQGHDAALADMVRVIRTFRPDVLVSRFQGTPRDGHGHHQAAGILTREAFRAAADPTRFPEQLKEGLAPWQAKKLYVDNVRPPGSAAEVAADAYTLSLDTGAGDSLLGRSYIQYAMEGLKHQLSQGAGAWNVAPGPHVTYYKLVDSVLPMPKPGAHERSFFEGIDTSVPGLAVRLGKEESAVPFLRAALVKLQGDIQRATEAAKGDAAGASQPLLAALEVDEQVIEKVKGSQLSAAAKSDLLMNLQTKKDQLQQAVNLALGVELQATIDAPPGATPDDVPVAVPAQSFTVHVQRLAPGGVSRVEFVDTRLDVPQGWRVTPIQGDTRGESRFRVEVPANAEITRPYWHRDNPETDTIYTVDELRYATLPFSPPPVHAHTTYRVNGQMGTVETTVGAAFRDGNEVKRMPLAVAPALSVAVDPATQVLPLSDKNGSDVTVTVEKHVAGGVEAIAKLETPKGWRVEPSTRPIQMKTDERSASVTFHVVPSQLSSGRHMIRALVERNGKTYSDAYTVITRNDLRAAFYYQAAVDHVSVVDVKVPHDLKVGYIMGAGDDIPLVLKQIGMDVSTIGEQELATGDLKKYGTIVVGIRAYDTREDVRKYNARLLDYVSSGGTLLVQYNTGVGDFNGGHYTPYPAQLSRDRVTVEEAPVQVLAPQEDVFHYPNQITAADFDGWVQERGLYFMSSWDAHFEPLLESHDPGEEALKGGLLRAQYGKGVYLYTGYSFFRQLPAGVPGAIRLFVNLVSTGHAR